MVWVELTLLVSYVASLGISFYRPVNPYFLVLHPPLPLVYRSLTLSAS